MKLRLGLLSMISAVILSSGSLSARSRCLPLDASALYSGLRLCLFQKVWGSLLFPKIYSNYLIFLCILCIFIWVKTQQLRRKNLCRGKWKVTKACRLTSLFTLIGVLRFPDSPINTTPFPYSGFRLLSPCAQLIGKGESMASLLQKLGGLQLNAEHRFRRLRHKRSQEKSDPFLDSRGEGK